MKIRNKGAVIIAFALVAMIARPHIVFAQAAPTPIIGSWDGVKAVPSGDKVEVELRNGQKLKGRLISVSDTILAIRKGNNTIDATRADAIKVYRGGVRTSTARSTLLGLGIGAGSGAVAGAIAAGAAGGSEDSGLLVLILGAGGAIGGTIGGFLIGISRKKQELIYEAR